MMKRGQDAESAPTENSHGALCPGIDVSLEFSSVCVVHAQGKIARGAKVASEPEALRAFFASLGFEVKRVGLEAGPLMAACGPEANRIRYCSAGDATCESGVIRSLAKGLLLKLLGVKGITARNLSGL
jgi:hypothetical protein